MLTGQSQFQILNYRRIESLEKVKLKTWKEALVKMKICDSLYALTPTLRFELEDYSKSLQNSAFEKDISENEEFNQDLTLKPEEIVIKETKRK